uniref:EamA domain-containing protein n=1 Tax=Bicosoecida sp. CB-2014 TaxID=1486930 RepID=A0A7S1CLN1_9STRA|mmetsp:Transcript_5525/g.19789  ORF Transcript_5525/g.19789 Transcript_5525/m.19789 type:complete len:464 (+) Transcript_5525:226-1617(+)
MARVGTPLLGDDADDDVVDCGAAWWRRMFAVGRARVAAWMSGKNAMVLLALVALVLSRTCDQTLYYRISFSYRYFVWYFSSVILAVPISWIVVWWKMWRGDITPEMRRFPQHRYAIMALFDASFNIFSTFPVPHLGGDLSNVLSQGVLPINMLGSAVFLRTRYKKVHYWGALLVVYGILVKLSPDIGSPSFGGSAGWVLLMLVAQTPAAASNIYKEIALKETDLDVWYMNAWVGVYQLLWGLLTFWTLYIPAFVSPHPPVDPGDTFKFMSEANDCFLGTDVRIYDNTTAFAEDCVAKENVFDSAGGFCTVNCDRDGTPLQVFVIYICFNLTYNLLALYIFKHGSSVLFVVANAVRLPLVDALNSWSFVSGQAHQDFGKYDVLSLMVLVLSLWIYYSESESTAAARGPDDEDYTDITVSPRVGSGFRHRVTSQAKPGRRYSTGGYTREQQLSYEERATSSDPRL